MFVRNELFRTNNQNSPICPFKNISIRATFMPFAPTRPHLLHLSIRLQPTSRTLAPKRPHPSKPPHLPAPPGRVDKARVRIASLSLSLSRSNSHSLWLVIDPLAVVNSCNLPHVSQLIAIFWYFYRFLHTKKKLPLRQWEFCFHSLNLE